MNVWRILLICFLISAFAFNLYFRVHGIHEFYGTEEFATAEQANEFMEQIDADAVSLGAEVLYSFSNDDNEVSYKVFAPKLDTYPYGEKNNHIWQWVLVVLQGIFVIFNVIYYFVDRMLNSPAAQTIPLNAFVGTNFITKTKTIGDNSANKSRHKARVVKEIKIPHGTTGIIATRVFIQSGNKLHSVTTGCEWTSRTVTADKKPSSVNDNGIYAYQLGRRCGYSGSVMAIVALYGKCRIGQDQGIIRAEHCKILLLITDVNPAELSKRYGVSVIHSRFYNQDELIYNQDELIEQWLITDEGIYWLKHNSKLIKSLTRSAVVDPVKQAVEIMEKQNF